MRPGTSGQALERLLAKIYTDPATLELFLADPVGEAERAGCTKEEAARLGAPDAAGLRMAHRSFRLKRAWKESHSSKQWWRRLF